jgi:hypothetical protein
MRSSIRVQLAAILAVAKNGVPRDPTSSTSDRRVFALPARLPVLSHGDRSRAVGARRGAPGRRQFPRAPRESSAGAALHRRFQLRDRRPGSYARRLYRLRISPAATISAAAAFDAHASRRHTADRTGVSVSCLNAPRSRVHFDVQFLSDARRHGPDLFVGVLFQLFQHRGEFRSFQFSHRPGHAGARYRIG